MTPKQAKPKAVRVRVEKRKKAKARRRASTPHLDRLFRAVVHYIDKEGGNAVVAGPVQIIRWPGDPEFKFTLAVVVMGRAPTSKEKP